MNRVPRLTAGVWAVGLTAIAVAAQALPQRSLVARPLPPGVLTAADSDAPGGTLSLPVARALADSLLIAVSNVRELKPLRPVPVQAASRVQIRARLEEITRQDAIDTVLRQEEKRLEFMGLVPKDLDLVKLFHDLLEEQLAGFYDIDKRELVLADWLTPEQTAVVASHELDHALQDQHFSLRVRKRLGFESPDAEAAWHALIEGDATAVMAELALRPQAKHFTVLAESSTALDRVPPAARAAAGGFESKRFQAAPPVVREELSFPYVQGLRYVTALYRQGGWKAVDAAYIHPPASTEQILHPERVDNLQDTPIRITIPDLRGMLGESWQPVASGTLGEQQIKQYLAHHVDPEVARVAAEGWGGCSYALYETSSGEAPALALASMWDSDDDAVEFFGGLIGVLESRYPGQLGDPETSTQDQVIWKLDKDGKRVNVLRLHERQVTCLEGMPGTQLMRVLAKLDTGLKIEDPSPQMRAKQKSNLAWNRRGAPLQQGALRPRVTLPAGWARVTPTDADSLVIFAAQKGAAQLQLAVDRTASRELGLDGYAHAVAAQLQSRGKNIYVQTDVDFPREGDTLYQHVFTQDEAGETILYYLGVADLGQGLGYMLLRGPEAEGSELERTFYELLGSMELVPENTDSAPPAAGDSTPEPKG